MGGKRKRNLIKPISTIVRTPASLSTRYDFVPRTATDPPVLPKNTRQPSVKDYPPPNQLFQGSTAPPSGASPSAQPESPAASANRASPTAPPLRAPPASQIGRGASPAPPSQPQNPAPLTQVLQSRPPRHETAPSHHSSQAQNSHHTEDEEQEEFSDLGAPPEPNLSQDQMEALNSLLLAPRPKKITVLDPDLLEPDSTW